MEYFQLVRIEEDKGEDEGTRRATRATNEEGGQRVRRTRFKFHERHQLRRTHEQHLGDKVLVPILAGKPPPAMNGPKATGGAKARWAAYWSAILIEWQYNDATGCYDQPAIFGFAAMNALLMD